MTETMNNTVCNPSVVLREEFDDWAILFDPDKDDVFGLDPVAVFIWKRLDGKHTVEDILSELKDECEDMPEDAEKYVSEFIQSLEERGLAGHEVE